MSREAANMDGNVVSTNAQVPNDDNVETTAAVDGTAVGDGEWSLFNVAATKSLEKSFSKLTT